MKRRKIEKDVFDISWYGICIDIGRTYTLKRIVPDDVTDINQIEISGVGYDISKEGNIVVENMFMRRCSTLNPGGRIAIDSLEHMGGYF